MSNKIAWGLALSALAAGVYFYYIDRPKLPRKVSAASDAERAAADELRDGLPPKAGPRPIGSPIVLDTVVVEAAPATGTDRTGDPLVFSGSSR